MWVWVICGIMLQICYMLTEKKEDYVSALILKAAAASCFVILGIRCMQPESVYCRWIVAGLIFGMLGDVILNVKYLLPKWEEPIFLGGTLAFLLGHVWYLAGLIGTAGERWWIPGIPGLILGMALLTLVLTICRVSLVFQIFGLFYVNIITLMAVYGIWDLYLVRGTGQLIFAAGGVIFLISDLVLIFNTFRGEAKQVWKVVNLTLYYLGQLLIAGSLFWV